MKLAFLALVACGGAQHAAPAKAATLDDLGWLQGTWHSQLLDAHWQSVAGALYGIALNDQGFEVNIIDDSDNDGKPSPIALVAAPVPDVAAISEPEPDPEPIVVIDEHVADAPFRPASRRLSHFQCLDFTQRCFQAFLHSPFRLTITRWPTSSWPDYSSSARLRFVSRESSKAGPACCCH